MLNRTSLLVGFAALAFVGAAFAASDNSLSPRIEKRIERITERLNLSPEQAESLAVVMREQAAKRKALRDETQSRIDELLNDEQRAQVTDFREQRKERRQARRQARKAGKGKDCAASSSASVIAPESVAQRAYRL